MLTPNHSHHPALAPTRHHAITLTDGQPVIIGVDEVGRGCLFGHMSVAAAILPAHLSVALDDDVAKLALNDSALATLNDSKKLSEKKRRALSGELQTLAGYAIVDVPAAIIDEINIHEATLLGMKSAIQALLSMHACQAANTHIYIDGSHAPLLDTEFSSFTQHQSTWVKGDSRHASMACASILAKVHRDTQMADYARIYPNHAIDQHKGYPTKAHLAALAEYGILPEHRISFAPVRAAHLKQFLP